MRRLLVFFIFMALFSSSAPARAQVIPIPAIIAGTITIDGNVMTQDTDDGIVVRITRPDGTSFNPPAEDNDGLTGNKAYIIDIPLFDDEAQPGGANPGETGILHLFREDTELEITTPPNGQFTIGESGSQTEINIVARGKTAQNLPPTAEAGDNQSVKSGETVTLNGSSSTDPEGGTLTCLWKQIAGPAVSLTNETALLATFTAPDVNTAVSLEFRLTVTDNQGQSATDETLVTVSQVQNIPPVANAGPNQTVAGGVTVILNGTASSGDDIISYAWEQTAGPAVSLTNETEPLATFTAPDGETAISLEFRLTVTDTHGQSATDEVLVTVTVSQTQNIPPVANAGPNRTVAEGVTVILDGTNSTDPDADSGNGIVSYAWEQTDGPGVMLSNAASPKPSFIAPTVGPDGAALIFQLTVTDAKGAVASVRVTINVSTTNRPPVANAGPTQAVTGGTEVTLDASGSYDPDAGDGISGYAWRQITGQTVSLSNPATARPTFTAPVPGNGGIALVFEVTVTDNGGLQDSAQVVVNVTSPENQPPVADAGPDQTVSETAAVTLDGSGSNDPENKLQFYFWSQIGGTPVSLSDASAVHPTFKAPEVGTTAAVLTFELTVTDSGGLRSTARVVITVKNAGKRPIAAAGKNRTASPGTLVILDGSASSDADGTINAFLWAQVWGEPSVTLSDAKSPKASFIAPTVGGPGASLVFELTVVDNEGLEATDQVLITIPGDIQMPIANAGPDQVVNEGSNAYLNASGSSSPSGKIISYAWQQLTGPPISLDTSAIRPVFFVPAVNTSNIEILMELTVTDSNGLVATDQVKLFIYDFGKGPGDDGNTCFIDSVWPDNME